LATLDRKTLLSLARAGAEARIRELQQQIAAIRNTFGMRGSARAARTGGPRKRGKLSAAGRRAIIAAQKARWAAVKAGKAVGKTVGKKRKGMSAAARKAVGARMKKYWAARRKNR
jgi:hypothetical protein